MDGPDRAGRPAVTETDDTPRSTHQDHYDHAIRLLHEAESPGDQSEVMLVAMTHALLALYRLLQERPT